MIAAILLNKDVEESLICPFQISENEKDTLQVRFCQMALGKVKKK